MVPMILHLCSNKISMSSTKRRRISFSAPKKRPFAGLFPRSQVSSFVSSTLHCASSCNPPHHFRKTRKLLETQKKSLPPTKTTPGALFGKSSLLIFPKPFPKHHPQHHSMAWWPIASKIVGKSWKVGGKKSRSILFDFISQSTFSGTFKHIIRLNVGHQRTQG